MKIKTQRNFKRTLMKGLMVLIFGMGGFVSFAQPGFVHTNVGSSYTSTALTVRGAVRFLRIQEVTGGTKECGFPTNANFSPSANAWRPYSSQTLSGFNTFVSAGTTAGARLNSSNGGAQLGLPTTTSNRYYTFIIGSNSGSDNNMSVLQTTYNPVTLTSSRNITIPNNNQIVTISVTLSTTKDASERVFLRWSTDGFSSNNNFTEITSFPGNIGTATIPAQTNGTTVSYYILSTEEPSPSAPTIDYFTLNLDNNSNSNYSYTVDQNRWEAAATGNWSTASTWATSSAVPNSTSHNVFIKNSQTITLDQAATVATLTINSGGTFTASDNTARTLTITKSSSGTSTTLANSGTWSNGVGGSTVTFTGAPSSGDAIHNVTGTIAFRNVIINKTSGSSNVGAFFNAGQTLTNSIEIGTGGYVSEDVANFYGASTTLIFNQGTGANYDVNNADNTWPNSNPAPNITVNSGTVTINTARFVTAGGTLTVASGATLASGGNLTIKSDATGTASIGNSAGSISGNVIVERYVSSSGRRWRFLSSPVQSKTIADWKDQFCITGPGTTTNSTIGDLNSNGWHQTYNNVINSTAATTTSVRKYDEVNSTSLNLNLGWSDVTTATGLTAGKGFRTFIRGPVADKVNQLGASGNSYTQAAVTLSLSGAINSGNISAPSLTYSGAGRGWNLLGNPYPCAFDWNAFHDAGRSGNSGTDYTNIDANVYIYDGTSNSYKSYSATANSGTLTNGIIPSGAGFFVQATASSPTLTFKETYKTTSSAPIALHKTMMSDEFTLKFLKDETESDEIIVKMIDGATLNKDGYDINKLENENLNLSAYGTDNNLLTLSAIPFVSEETRMKLNVEANEVGTYKFDFTNMDNFDAGVSVSLLDKYTNTTSDVRKNTKYTFEMGPGENQLGKNRFELILNKSNTGVENILNSIASTNLIVFPNPATDILNINLSNANFKNSNIVVYNVSGMEVSKSIMNGASAQLNIESLSNGVYFVKVSNENGFSKTVKFVK